ncbi:hypothetical protein PFLmoz3_05888 [Pseudomonas fluorescens]|uniref:Uncharacterized protein n=1 Tax=Pseudomonas fluorescens TaxID=294 RepID=A0A109LBI0_PSEFL|nr:hypothetical protein PFLmoz3_05888 [Pseudomonas fluorescens]
MSETLPITLRIGLLQHIAHRVELQSTASTDCLLKQIIPLIEGQWPIRHIQALQITLGLRYQLASYPVVVEMTSTGRVILAHHPPTLITFSRSRLSHPVCKALGAG